MAFNPYVYTADDGTDYTIYIPDDFASAMGFTAASGQPILPSNISPRYGAFATTGGITRQAVFPTLASFASALGTVLTVNTLVYTCYQAQGEFFPPTQTIPINGAALIQGPPGIQGPTGPQGPPGLMLTTSGTFDSSTILAMGSRNSVVIAAPPSGQVIVPIIFTAQMYPGSSPYNNFDVGLYYEGQIGPVPALQCNPSGFTDQSVPFYAASSIALYTSIASFLNPVSNVSGVGVCLGSIIPPTGGNGTMNYNIGYLILPL